MARPAPTARSSALRILNSVLGEGRLMSEVLGTGLLDPLSALIVRVRSDWPMTHCAGWSARIAF